MSRNRGFSLLECLLVVAIVALLAAISIPRLLASRRAAIEAQALANLRTFSNAQMTFYASNGRFALPRELVASNCIPVDSFVRSGSGAGAELSDGDYSYSARFAIHSSGVTLDADPIPVNAEHLRRFRIRLGRTAASRGGGEGVMLFAIPSRQSPPTASYRPLGS